MLCPEPFDADGRRFRSFHEPGAATYGTIFEGNQAVYGGAVYITQSTLWVYDAPYADFQPLSGPGVLFKDNHAVSGGAVMLYDTQAVTVQVCQCPGLANGLVTSLRVPLLTRR